MIKVINLTKKIKTNNNERNDVLFSNININFYNTGLYVFLGKSGCGKTTFLNILEGIDKDYLGDIYFEDENYKYKNKVSNNFGISFQDFNLINDLNVYDNLKLQLDILGINDYDLIQEIAKKLKIENILYSKIENISGGELQRLAIARALLKNPKVLFFDEPTGSVDMKNSYMIFEILKDISKNKLVIVVTHDVELTQKYADVIYEFSNNSIHQLKNENVKEITNNKELTNTKTESNNNKIIKLFNKANRKNFSFFNKILLFSIFIITLICNSLLFINLEINNINNNKYNYFFNSNVYTVSKKINIKKSSSVKLINYVRPSINEIINLKEFNYCYIDYSFDYIFNYCSLFVDNIEFNNFILFEPQFLDEENFFFTKNFQFNNNKLDLKIYFENNYLFNNEVLYENIGFSFENISYKVIDDIFLMNTYVIYYPYLKIKKYFQNILITNQNGQKNNLYSYIKYLNNEDLKSNYKLILYNQNFNRELDVDSLSELYEIKNNTLDNWENYNSILKIIFILIYIFIIFSFIGFLIIVSYLLFTRILFNRKNIAILKVIGANKNTIFNIYSYDIKKYSILGIIISLNFSFIIYFIYIYVLKISTISIINLLIVLGVNFILFFIIKFITSFLSFYIKKINIKKELNSI